MITEEILNVVKNIMMWIIGILPTPDKTIGAFLGTVGETFINILQSVAYILPVGDILIMLGFWFGIYTFTIIWKIIQRIWDAIPFT